MITSEDMKKVEERAEEAGIKAELMMENAGRSVAEVVSNRADLKDKRIGIVCGTGNNGGDGFCASRHLLCEGADVQVYIYGDPGKIGSREARSNYEILENLGMEIKPIETSNDIPDFEELDILIDSVLGLGLEGELRGFLPGLIKSMNEAEAFKVAVDVPTGLNSDTAKPAGEIFEADLTVTFYDIKPGLKGDICGEIFVEGIGVPCDLD
jgi:NAD(P)H-hydrate epimerase